MSEYVFIDLETTGLDYDEDRIIEVGAVRVDSKLNRLGEFHSLINPEKTIPYAITILTKGLDNEMVKDAPTIDEVKNELLSFIGTTPLIAHNAGFEQNFLSKLGVKNQYMDTMELFSLFFPSMESLKLDTIIKFFGIRDSENHRALDDAEDLYQVLLRLATLIEDNEDYYMVAERLLSYFGTQEWAWAGFVKELMPKQKPIIKESTKKETRKKEILKTNDLKLSSFKVNAEHLYSLITEPLEKREGQKNYMQEVCESFNKDASVMIEAGTGIGKTLGYLLPAMDWSISNSSQVLISTKTKILQNQIMEKDIPLAKSLLGLKNMNAVKIQGRNNYLCVRKMDRFFSELDLLDDFEAKFAKLFFYAIDRLNDVVDFTKIHPWVLRTFPSIKRSLSILCAESATCMQSKCHYYESCHYFRMVREANRADILITNHSLILNWPAHLPKGDKIIFDEAHNLNSEATSASSVIFDSTAISSLVFIVNDEEKNRGIATELRRLELDPLLVAKLETLVRRLKAIDTELMGLYKALFEDIKARSGRKLNYDYAQRFILYSPTIAFGQYGILRSKEWMACAVCFSDLLGVLDEAEQVMKDVLIHLSDKEYKMIVESVLEKVLEYKGVLQSSVALSSSDFTSDNEVIWISWSERNPNWELGKAFIDVGSILAEKVYPNYSSCIFTSATLKAGKNTLATELGFDKIKSAVLGEEVKSMPSPFDYKEHSKVFFLKNSFNPNFEEKKFMEHLNATVSDVVRMLNGKTLVLFASIKRMNLCFDMLVKELVPEGFKVLRNNMGGDVISYFMNEDKAVLLGSEAFGEGLDIKGDKISCVILERMPVLQPSPIYTARAELYKASTGERSALGFELPYRLLKLRQWSGRLIRGMDDKGTVLVCDKWFYEQSAEIKKMVVESLQPMPVELVATEDVILSLRRSYKDWGYNV